MAAATEKMAIHHDWLIRDLAWYKEQYNNARATLQHLGRSHSSLKGQITKLRDKSQAIAQPNISRAEPVAYQVISQHGGSDRLYAAGAVSARFFDTERSAGNTVRALHFISEAAGE